MVARGSSYRAKDNELVQHDQPWARLDAHVASGPAQDGDIRTVKIVNDPVPAKTYEIEGRTFRRLPAAKTLPVVVFEPNHLIMLSGPPDLRRSYLDDLLEQTDPAYARTRKDYRRVLTQRNTLLKRLGMGAAGQIFPWNVRLSELGGSMVQSRLQLLETMNAEASELYGSLAHKPSQVELRYETKLSQTHYASALLHKLEVNFSLDVARGFTGNGPHREDISVHINGHPSQTAASRGETRTAVLMLKVMELRLVEQSRAQKPLLLLDDVFSELDGKRRQALTSYLQDYQTFITTTDADLVLEHFTEQATIIPINQ